MPLPCLVLACCPLPPSLLMSVCLWPYRYFLIFVSNRWSIPHPLTHTHTQTTLNKTLRQVKHGAQESLGLDVIERFGRTFIYGLLTSIDYKSLSFSGLEKDSEEYKKKQSEVHLRSAKRILYVCQAHGGVYTKAGQYISSLVKIVPDEYTDLLRALQDKV